MTDSLASLVEALRLAGLDVDAEAALDSVWLGLRMRERMAGVAGNEATAMDLLRTGTVVDRPLDEGLKRESTARGLHRDTLTSRAGHLRTGGTIGDETSAAPAHSVTLARAAALPESRDLIRALRPLRRRVVSPGTGLLDIDGTVRRAAEEDLWVPTFAPARERWLDVLLVADHGLSMIIWNDTIDEFEGVLRNSGAFRSVRSWWLESDAATPAIAPRGSAAHASSPQALPRLARALSRSIILVVSDCVGPRWHDGAIPRLLAEWSQKLPVGLVQVTPEWFWARTALADTVTSAFRSPVPASINRRLRWDTATLGEGAVPPEIDKTLLRVPAATLTAASVSRVADLVAGVGREWTPGVVFDLTAQGDEASTAGLTAGAQERLAYFHALATKPAQRLAASFAASPVRTLGVLRLLRRDLLPSASPFTEAEVLLGGVLRVRREDARWDLGADLPLEFFPGVQPLLLDGAVAADVLRVLAHAANVAASGVGPTFTTWLTDPAKGAALLDPSESEFAASAAEVLSRLGGSYARIVKPPPAGTADSGVARESETVQPKQATQPLSPGGDAGVIGPHEPLAPKTLVGRTQLVDKILRWHQEEFAQPPMILAGPAGVGKTAIAAHVAQDWLERWPREGAFFWTFYEHRSASAALDALRSRYAPAGGSSADTRAATIAGLSRRARSLVVFDGLDAIENPTERQSLLELAGEIAKLDNARVLLTARERPELSGSLEVLDVGPLGRDDFGVLIATALDVERAARSEPEAEMVSILFELSGGNPLVALTLLPNLLSMPSSVVLEELGQDPDSRRAISSQQLRETLDVLERVGRARELSAVGDRHVQEGMPYKALGAFDEVVAIRRTLPSLRLQAEALADRGRVSLTLGRNEEANADLDGAVTIYRALSADRERASALQWLARARAATGHLDEAVQLSTEALMIARTTEDLITTFSALSNLAGMEMQQNDFQRALAHLSEAALVAQQMGNLSLEGAAHFQRARVFVQLNERDRASADARSAAELYESVNETARAAEARALLEQIEQHPADSDGTQTVGYLVSGRVQGVGFRSFVKQIASELGLQGEATNQSDGSVRVAATGPRVNLQKLEARLRQGPPGADVKNVEVRVLDDDMTPETTETPEPSRASVSPVTRRLELNRHRAVIAIGAGSFSGLPKLTDAVEAAHSVAEWATESQGIPPELVSVFTDESSLVAGSAISAALRSLVDSGDVTQLIVYFAGYGVGVVNDRVWLLSRGPQDRNAGIAVNACTRLARRCGIPNVVFVSDACHVSGAVVSTTDLVGLPLFPNTDLSDVPVAVDEFHANAIARPRTETADAVATAERYKAMFTRALLMALNGHDRSLLEDRDGIRFLRSRSLAPYLQKVAPTLSASVGNRQQPDVRIESGDDAWLACFD